MGSGSLAEVAISLSETAKDSWVVFELPGFTEATSGNQQDTLDALRKATGDFVFQGFGCRLGESGIPTAPKGVPPRHTARQSMRTTTSR